MKEKAKIYTYTIVNVPTEEFKGLSPYVIAVIEKEGKLEKTLTRIEGYKDGMKINIGDEIMYSGIDEQGNEIYKFVK